MSAEGRKSSLYGHTSAVSLDSADGKKMVVCGRLESRDRSARARRFLLLHGNPGNLDSFVELAPVLSRMGEVAFVDTPGFGKSPALPGGAEAIDLGSLARLFQCLLGEMGWDRCIVVGHSHGGGVAQTMAARDPSRIEGVVLLGSLGFPAHWSYRLLPLPGMETLAGKAGTLLGVASLRKAARAVVSFFMRPVFHPHGFSSEQLDEAVEMVLSRPDTLRHMVELTKGRPSRMLMDQIDGIAAPTLFIHGKDDLLVAPAFTRSLHEARIRSGRPSRFVLIEGAGHMLPLFQAEEVGRLVDRWISQRLS